MIDIVNYTVFINFIKLIEKIGEGLRRVYKEAKERKRGRRGEIRPMSKSEHEECLNMISGLIINRNFVESS